MAKLIGSPGSTKAGSGWAGRRSQENPGLPTRPFLETMKGDLVTMIGTTYRLAVEGALGLGGTWVNTWHYRVTASTSGDTQEEMGALLAEFLDAPLTTYIQLLAAVHRVDRIVIKTISGPPQGLESIVNLSGSRAGDPLPPQASCEVMRKAILLGRRYTSRLKLPPAVEGDQSGGVWAAGYIAGVDQLMGETVLLSDGAGMDFELVVYSPTYGLVNQVVSYKIENNVRNQPSRMA